MSSSRKSERRRSRESSPKPRLRMDSYQTNSRNERSSRSSYRGSSAPRSKELNTVMKKARSGGSQSNYWNKRLLEVEEKDPNRWRHSGYKELYHGDKKSNSGSRSRSVSRGPRSPRSPRSSRSVSVGRSRSRSRSFSRPRSPRQRSSKPRSPRPRSPRPRSPRPRSPRPRSPRTPRSPRSPPLPPPKARSPRSPRRTRRPPSPKARSESYSSSDSSCSDESCSVCSPKNSRNKTADAKKDKDKAWNKERAQTKERERDRIRRNSYRPFSRSRSRSRSRSFSVPRSRANERRFRRPDPRTLSARERAALRGARSHFIKVESDSESSGSGSGAGGPGGTSGGPKLSLSERFGKMAQWSVDRDLEHRNLRITSGDRLTVEMDSPPSPSAPYPPSLSSLMEYGSWDDVRTRYAYYKDQGWLRDLTLQDYLRWEQWWYKYQDWLDSERYYDRYSLYRRRL